MTVSMRYQYGNNVNAGEQAAHVNSHWRGHVLFRLLICMRHLWVTQYLSHPCGSCHPSLPKLPQTVSCSTWKRMQRMGWVASVHKVFVGQHSYSFPLEDVFSSSSSPLSPLPAVSCSLSEWTFCLLFLETCSLSFLLGPLLKKGVVDDSRIREWLHWWAPIPARTVFSWLPDQLRHRHFLWYPSPALRSQPPSSTPRPISECHQ